MPKDHLGKEYPSFTAMAKAYGLTYNAVKKRLASGWDLKRALTTPSMETEHPWTDPDGVEFPNLKLLAEHHHLDYDLLRQRMHSGWPLARAMREPARQMSLSCVDAGGRAYASRAEMARAHGMKANTVISRLNAGKSIEEVLTPPPSLAVKDHLGNEYASLSEMARAYEKNFTTVQARIHDGVDVETALTAPNRWVRGGRKWTPTAVEAAKRGLTVAGYLNRKKKGIPLDMPNRQHPVKDHLGNEFSTIKSMLEHYKVQRETFNKRRRYGWTLEECLLGRKRKRKSRISDLDLAEAEVLKKSRKRKEDREEGREEGSG